MESLEQVRESIHAAIGKFALQETQAPVFGGKAGESVPEVDSDDLKAIWQIGEELRAKHPGTKAALGVEVMKRACKPGANVEATWYRSSAIWMVSHIGEQLAPRQREGKVADPVFRTMASIPMAMDGNQR